MTQEGGDLPQRKAEMRREVAARLKAIAPRDFAERSRRAAERLGSATDFQSARSLLLYAAMPDEIDVDPLIDALLAAGETVFLPVCHEAKGEMRAVRIADRARDLAAGRYGIREPRPGLPAAAPGEIDFVLVPGRAFDRNGRRLGRGAGFYDRFLSGDASGAFRAALALDAQVFPEVPTGPDDRPVHLVVTESQLIRTGGE